MYKVSVVFEVYLYMFPLQIFHTWCSTASELVQLGRTADFFPDEFDMLDLITVPCPGGVSAGLNIIHDG